MINWIITIRSATTVGHWSPLTFIEYWQPFPYCGPIRFNTKFNTRHFQLETMSQFKYLSFNSEIISRATNDPVAINSAEQLAALY